MTYRCFIAINLPESIKTALAKVVRDLKNKNSSRAIVYVQPENIHITLHFLGNVAIEKLPELENAISEIAKAYKNFEFSLDGFEAFPNFINPRVLYLGAKGDVDIARKIQRDVGEKLFNLGFVLEEREWVPHFTLARIKSKVRLDINIEIPKIKFMVESIELMRSELSPSGPRYSIIESCKLMQK